MRVSASFFLDIKNLLLIESLQLLITCPRRSVVRQWISVVNLCSMNTGFPHVHPARDGGMKSTGCPHGVRSSMAKKGAFLPTDITELKFRSSEKQNNLLIVNEECALKRYNIGNLKSKSHLNRTLMHRATKITELPALTVDFLHHSGLLMDNLYRWQIII